MPDDRTQAAREKASTAITVKPIRLIILDPLFACTQSLRGTASTISHKSCSSTAIQVGSQLTTVRLGAL